MKTPDKQKIYNRKFRIENLSISLVIYGLKSFIDLLFGTVTSKIVQPLSAPMESLIIVIFVKMQINDYGVQNIVVMENVSTLILKQLK